MERETVSRVSVHGAGPPNAVARAPFTSGQWAELEHQALIFKYMMAGVNVPSDLLNPIRKSVAALGLSPVQHHPSNAMGWGTFHLGVANNTDPEPGRCRRTDGKKWRCSRDVVPDQKYCERHMHRGRHRSRKPGDNQSSSSSQASGATGSSSSSPTAVSVAASRGGAATSQGAASALAHSNLRPAIAGPQQQQSSVSSLAAAKSYGGAGHSMNLAATGSAHFSLPMHSSSATSAMANSRYTHLGAHIKQEVGMGPEQMLFSEASGSTRGLVGQDPQSVSSLSMLPHSSMSNNPWRSMSPKVPPAPQPKAQMLQYPQMRSILGQDLAFLPDSSQQHQQQQVNMSLAAAVQAQAQQQAQQQAQHQAQQQQQASFGGGYESMSVGRGEPEGQPLRHFFDDWPRSSRDPQAALSWSDVEDERSNGSSSGNHNQQQQQQQQQQHHQQQQQQHQQQQHQRNNGSSNTQLSISIPMGDHRFNPNSTSASATASPPRGKHFLSPLKLSMSRAGEEEPLGMGLGVGCAGDDRHRQTTWIPITWETPVGGPLAEVLQSGSTPRGAAAAAVAAAAAAAASAAVAVAPPPGCKSSGLNLLCDGWDNSPRDSPRLASSPTGVLQKATFGSFSDSSSSGSSPRAGVIKSEPLISCTDHHHQQHQHLLRTNPSAVHLQQPS